jgi:DNA-binding response OmpR family regulator
MSIVAFTFRGSPKPERAFKAMKTLVVDDDRDTCRFISDALAKAGYMVYRTYDGESALSAIKSGEYGLMILDYKLPGINGLQVLEKVRQLDSPPIVIMISNVGSDDVKFRAKELGAYEFLDKPFKMENIVEVVKRASGNKK